MRHYLLLLLTLLPLTLSAEGNDALDGLAERIGGTVLKERVIFEITPREDATVRETFTLTSRDGRPVVQANSILAGAVGLGWYLNHICHQNLAWNSLSLDLSTASLPAPAADETHQCAVDYRYYMNYCTFSYSCAFWTWERWQQEIDWMALHGINMPLQAVGVDAVWRKTMLELGYTEAQVAKHIGGPGFQAWWLMNNQEGWGGENPEWWYARQEALAAKICARERELGMQPCLPGFSGQVPSSAIGTPATFGALDAIDQGSWCGFKRPAFERPGEQFQQLAEIYYRHLHDVMGGKSDFYSMDLFHEGGYPPSGVTAKDAYTAVFDAMHAQAGADAKWVIQQWQWTQQQAVSCTAVPKGRLIVLDLFSDGKGESGWTSYNAYSGQESVYCMLHNFGGRTGLHGRLAKTIDNYYAFRKKYSTINGVGATPEGIETNPILYDALFELPWREEMSAQTWLEEYALARYGTSDAACTDALRLLEQSVWGCTTSQQGTSEPILCARPALSVSSVSSWSTSAIYYDVQQLLQATTLLCSASGDVQTAGFRYDLTDCVRQCLTDEAVPLLQAIKTAYEAKDMDEFGRLTALWSALLADLDRLLLTEPTLSLYRWTQSARAIAAEAPEGYTTTTQDEEWLEWNARKQITTWGPEASANSGGLRDYSNREWSGMISHYYAPRWEKYFTALRSGTSTPTPSQWYAWEDAFCNDFDTQFTAPDVTEDGVSVAREVLAKNVLALDADRALFTSPLMLTGENLRAATPYYIYRGITQDASECKISAYRGEPLPLQCDADGVQIAAIALDADDNGIFAEREALQAAADGTYTLPDGLETGAYSLQVAFSDQTAVLLTLVVRDHVEAPRTVKAQRPGPAYGTLTMTSADPADKVTTEGAYYTVTTAADVTLTIVPTEQYVFEEWTRTSDTSTFSTRNPLVYTAADDIQLRPTFSQNLWTAPEEDLSEHSVLVSYKQYVEKFTSEVEGREQVIYTASAAPDGLFQVVPTAVSVPRGGSLRLTWQGAGGLNYCRLSAYADFNADGDFSDAGELLAVLGTKSATDARVNAGTLDIVLPYSAKKGITHVRLRFDGAWQTGLIDSTTDAVPADAPCMRMVYDIKLNVTDYPDYEVTIAAESEDEARGIISSVYGGEFDNQNPATVLPGKSLTLEAAARDGYAFTHWTDVHGRVASTENPYTFRPVESGTWTAHFDVYDALAAPRADATPTDSALYDIQGRPLPSPSAALGVYVEDGRKKVR